MSDKKNGACARCGKWPDDWFDQFWKLYPRKVSKGDARRALDKQRRMGTSFELIMNGVRTFAKLRPFREIEFCPYPATWINAERWDDEYPEQRENDVVWRMEKSRLETLARRKMQ